MLQRLLVFLTPNYGEMRFAKVVTLLLSLALFLRFPFFFRDYIDRDESTFILMAQSWVDGFLPYTHLWDLKPPLTFLFFAAIIKIFGKSLFMIRLLGSILVGITAIYTYKIGAHLSTKKLAFWTAICCVLLQSLFGSVQGVMSEHISVLPFCMGLYILLSKKDKVWFFVSGLLIGAAILSKLNMVYPAFFLGLFLLYEIIRDKKVKEELFKLILWVMGMLLALIITAVPYYLQGKTTIWWDSVFMAPLAYSSTKINSVFHVLPFCAVLLSVILVLIKFKLLNYRAREIQLLLAILAGIVVSFLQTGKINGHYLIQLYPFLLLLLGIALNKLKSPKNPNIGYMVFFAALLIPFESYKEYANIIQNKAQKGSFYNGEGFTVPQYLVENKIDTKNVFFTEYHIGYWVLGEMPPTKVAIHPSNITREELFPFMNNPRKNSMDELVHILEDVRPNVIVVREKRKVFNKEFPNLNQYVNAYLHEYYTKIAVIDQAAIYKRSE